METGMDISMWLGWIVAAVSVVVLVVFFFRYKPANVTEAVNLLSEATETAKTIVMAAEQLYKTGKLPQDGRFDYAAQQLAVEFPGLDTNQLRMTIEAAVYWIKTFKPQA